MQGALGRLCSDEEIEYYFTRFLDLGLLLYDDIIPRAQQRDLALVSDKVVQGQYANMNEFFADCRLVASNTKIYYSGKRVKDPCRSAMQNFIYFPFLLP